MLFRWICCVGTALMLVGCGPIGGFNYNWQRPGGDTQKPTELGERTGTNNFDPDDAKSPYLSSHARLGVSKDGRFVLFTKTRRSGIKYYQPSKDNNGWQEFEEMLRCTQALNSKKTARATYTLQILDLKQDKLYETEISTGYPRLSVILHPDSKSFFVAEYHCQHNTSEGIQPFVAIQAIHQIGLLDQRKIRTYRMGGTYTDRQMRRSSVHAWHAMSSNSKGVQAIPSGQTRFSLSPQASYLGLYRHAIGDKRGHELYVIHLKGERYRRIELGAPVIHMHFTDSEEALYVAASKEFETVAKERKARCWDTDNRQTKSECTDLKAWMDVARIGLKQEYRLDTQALALGYSVESHIRIHEAAHGQAAWTPTLSFSPDRSKLVLSMCDRVNWKSRACSGKLYILNAQTLEQERIVPGLGPAAFSPDGSTLVAWDGVRNEYEQVVVPLMRDSDVKYKHWMVLINTKNWSRTPVPMPFFAPLYFLTPKKNFVVAVSDLQGDRILITDLDSGQSVSLKGKVQMAEFSVSNDGSVLYSVERGGVTRLDLKRGTLSDLVPQGNYVENVMVLPPYSAFARNTKPSSRVGKSRSFHLEKIRLQLKGRVLRPEVIPPTSIPAAVEASKDAILISRHARKLFEILDDSSAVLYRKEL